MNKFNEFFDRNKTVLYTVLLVLTVCLASVVLVKTRSGNLIESTELKTFDLRQSITADSAKVSDDVVILTVDDESYEYLINRYGEWPVPRYVYGELLDYIETQNPYTVTFDLLFVHSMKSNPGSDARLADAFKKYDNAFTAINFDDRTFDIRKPVILPEYLTSNLDIQSADFNPPTIPNCRSILTSIIDSTQNIGHINTPKSDDGITREVPLFVSYPRYTRASEGNYEYDKTDIYPYMTYKTALKYLEKKYGIDTSEQKVLKNNILSFGGKTIPMSKDGHAVLNWYGDTGLISNTTFRYIPLWKAIESMNPHGQVKLSSDTFKNKAVFIGTSVLSLSDIKSVPTAKYMPGVEIHATLFNNIIDNNFIKKVSTFGNLLISFSVASLVGLVAFYSVSVLVSSALSLLIILLYSIFSTWVMSAFNLWIWIVLPVVLSIAVFIGIYLLKYFLKSRDFEHTYKLATTDGLTELYNHRFFQDQLKICIEDCKRNNRNFSLILIDIDFFKKFNDTYGHQAGDAVLRQVAMTLKKSVRSSDIVCRYGGEEMTIILKDTGRDEAFLTAQKVCNNVAEKPFKIAADTEKNVTISLGVSTYPIDGTTAQELIEYSDRGLYAAKEGGRNRVGIIDDNK